ncbi:MAG: HEAT repeat domain-containing protein [Pyrinomonadaceae bacterium]
MTFAVVSASAQDLDSIRADLASGNIEIKRNALFQIKNLRTETASRTAVPALSDSEELVRATAATAVIFLPKIEAAKVLLPLLDDKTAFVRSEAAFALGETGDPSAVTRLILSLQKDSADDVRSASAIALGKIGDIAAVDALAAIFKKKPSDDNEFLRRSAARSIGQIAQIVKSGKKTVVTPQNFLPAKYKESPSGAPLTNSFPAMRPVLGVLANVLKNHKEADDTRREAAFALGAVGDESTISLLRSFLNSPDVYLAEICREALIKIDNPQ